MSKFYENDLSLDTLWRAIVLLGKNNKTYKFALAKSLIKLVQEGKQNISMQELAPYFAEETLSHIKAGKQQGVDNNRKGHFLSACESYLNEEISIDELYRKTEVYAFGDVIERFHTVNRSVVDKTFYDWSSFKTNKQIVIKDEIYNLLQSEHGSSLIHEIEARWNLVENAWELGIDPRLLDVKYDEEKKLFYLNQNDNGKTRRVNVTHSRDALNGYQKGHCFFCFDYISVNKGDENLCHVDHFFPHTLFDRLGTNVNYNGVWNLVLSCSSCNSTKSAQCPDNRFLARLHNRNEFYVNSHLPLRESILQTGASEKLRVYFLQERFNEAKNTLISSFDIEEKNEARF
ncbi:HNH endonuclease [Halobacteriovorax sp. ZH4_bin.1]|uniref:HNH endonuclease n=1 Tax=unclassified Halobacteriovorax TaxID=2639665 RepID=UPI003722E996